MESLPSGPARLTSAATLLILLAAALWGGTTVAVKFASEALPPIGIAAIRFGMASFCLAVLVRSRNLSLILKGNEFKLALIAGVMLFAQITLFNFAIKWSNASHSILLISTFIFWVLLIEHFVTREDRICLRTLSGMLLASSGVMVTLMIAQSSENVTTAANNDAPSFWGNGLMLLSAFLLGSKVVFTKYSVARMDPNQLMLWHHLIGTICFAIVSWLTEDWSEFKISDVTLSLVIAMLYQGILVGGLCFIIQASLLRYYTATQLSVFSFATPLFGVLAALFFRDDQFSPFFVMGAFCVAVGIYLVNSRRRPG